MGRAKDKDERDEPISTTGRKPERFAIDDSGDFFMIGSEVGAHLKMTRGLLYRKYVGVKKVFCVRLNIRIILAQLRVVFTVQIVFKKSLKMKFTLLKNIKLCKVISSLYSA